MNITKEDLMLTCEECGGSGKSRPEPVNQNNNYGMRLINGSVGKCRKCHGNGVIFTEAGQAIACVILQMQENGFNVGFLTEKYKS